MIVLKIIGSIILIISAVLDFLYIIEKERKEEIKKYGMHVCAGNFYGFCFALLVITAILLAHCKFNVKSKKTKLVIFYSKKCDILFFCSL